MAVGVFGKLPARRDYVQHGVDPRLMQVLDPWLQRCMTDSRRELGRDWLDAWLTAPIWRFWLGRRVAGVTALGAMMPSVDGVGRYFPLCVLGAFDAVAPPERDEQADWFAAAETLMLDALAEGGVYEDLLAGLAALAPPAAAAPAGADPGGDPGAAAGAATDVPAAFAAARAAMLDGFYDRFSCWWVPSPDGTAPARARVYRDLPSPADFIGLIAPGARPALAPAIGGA